MERLHNYIFHYNHVTKTWNAIPRDKYAEYWNNSKCQGVLCSSEMRVLLELINKGDEFIKSIKKETKKKN